MINREIEATATECDLVVPENPRGVVIIVDADWNYSGLRRARVFEDRLSTARYVVCTPSATPEWGVSLVSGRIPSEVERLADRVTSAAEAVMNERDLRRLPIGLLAHGRGSAAAMLVAANHPRIVRAVVTVDGRPDLAGIRLHKVQSPSLFLITRDDREVHQMNKWAHRRLSCMATLDVELRPPADVVPDADLNYVSQRAARWFDAHLPGKNGRTPRRSFFGLSDQSNVQT